MVTLRHTCVCQWGVRHAKLAPEAHPHPTMIPGSTPENPPVSYNGRLLETVAKGLRGQWLATDAHGCMYGWQEGAFTQRSNHPVIVTCLGANGDDKFS